MAEGRNRNKNQEAQNMASQEPNQDTLFLVGSWLRPYNFGFGHPLQTVGAEIAENNYMS